MRPGGWKEGGTSPTHTLSEVRSAGAELSFQRVGKPSCSPVVSSFGSFQKSTRPGAIVVVHIEWRVKFVQDLDTRWIVGEIGV